MRAMHVHVLRDLMDLCVKEVFKYSIIMCIFNGISSKKVGSLFYLINVLLISCRESFNAA